MVSAGLLTQLNFTVPLLCKKVPLVKAALSLSSRIPEVDVSAVPDKVKAPPTVMLEVPPVKVPPDMVAVPVRTMVLVFCEMVPVYPAPMLMLITVTAISPLQLPSPFPSKKIASATPGTDAPGAPPEVADQPAALLQFSAPALTQKRLAALVVKELKIQRKSTEVLITSRIKLVFCTLQRYFVPF